MEKLRENIFATQEVIEVSPAALEYMSSSVAVFNNEFV